MQSNMKTLKICLVILCLLPVRAVGLPQFSGANFFMGKFVDITGRKQGNLTVLKSLNEVNSNGSRYWVCLCNCGKEFKVSTSSLNSGVSSCGCIQRRKFIQSHIGKPSCNLKQKGRSSSNIIRQSYKDNAKKRGLSFNITYEQFIFLTSQDCFYCGEPPRQSMVKRSHNFNCNGIYYYNGLDRVDNSIGYEYNNVVPCCKVCNRAKFQMSKQDFISWVFKVYKKQNNS
jgi:hypothetical protein